MLDSFCFHLHPAALSKTRRAIFEKQIESHGGTRLNSLEDDWCRPHQHRLIVLIDDTLTDEEKRKTLARKCSESRVVKSCEQEDVQILRLSWLSECLEEGELVDVHKFRLEVNPVASSVPGSGRVSEEKTSATVQDVDQEASTSTGAVSSGPRNSYIERNKHKFVCAQSSDNPLNNNVNKMITDELEKLASAYKSTNDTWRAFGYQKAISAIKNFPRPITSREEASKIPAVGKKMAEKIVEIIEEGSLQKVHEVCDNEQVKVIALFTRIWGVGPTSAEQWYRQGFRTLEDLVTRKANLNKQQQVGLRLFDDLDERMDREECTEILETVRSAALEIQTGLEVTACGSYRRGKKTCGDLDVLITHPNEDALEGLFDKILSSLRKTGFLTDDLTTQKDGRQQKYLGVCRLPREGSKHRRLDIIVVPFEERSCAIMYFTGSAHFNRSMRLLAIKMGMSLSEHALVTNVVRHNKEKLNEGSVLPTPTEESVFQHLGIPYRLPSERNH